MASSALDTQTRGHEPDDPRPDEEELRRITDLIAQSIIVLDPDGRPVYANRFVLGYFGLTFDAMRADGFRECVFHPDDVRRLRDERLLEGSMHCTGESTRRAREGVL
jgi:PAS domain S-box-containing protein